MNRVGKTTGKKLLFWTIVLSMLIVAAMPIGALAAGGNWQDNGTDLAGLTPDSTGLVVCGSGITNGKGLLENLYYLTETEVATIKADKSTASIGVNNGWQTATLYSSYDNHGTPNYVYRMVEGINLQVLLTQLGVDTSQALSINAKATDGYAKTVTDAFASSRVYYSPAGIAGNTVVPLLAFYEDSVSTSTPTSETEVPVTTSAIAGNFGLFCFGQTSTTDHTGCSFVKGTNKIRVGVDQPGFTITINGEAKSISVADIALMGIYETTYTWQKTIDGVLNTFDDDLVGIPLAKLLEEMDIVLSEGTSLTFQVNDGEGVAAFPSRVVSYQDIDKCFLAYDVFREGVRIEDNGTALRLYCPGQFGNSVLIKNVVGAADSASLVDAGQKAPGGDIENSVFYLAVSDDDSEDPVFYYYTLDELQAYGDEEDYTYDDHSVMKTVTCRGALLSALLDDLYGVEITDEMIVQYAEEDGYHADAATPVVDSDYKDTVQSLTESTVNGSGTTIAPLNSIITYEIHEEYQSPDEFNQDDPEGVFKDADNHSGYLRIYRESSTYGANATVLKYVVGAAVSASGSLLSGSDGVTVKSVSDKNSTISVRSNSVIKGLIPGMQYAVKAPSVTNAVLATGETSPQIITVASGTSQTVTYQYTEDTYFFVKNGATVEKYTYTDLISQAVQVPTATTTPYGYLKPMYYRYNGVWLDTILGDLPQGTKVYAIGQDGKKTDISDDTSLYFVAYNNTQSKSSTNIPEAKRVTVTYDDAKIILPSTGESISGADATDYTSAGKDVDVLLAAADGVQVVLPDIADAFPDITGHWAKNYINDIALTGIIKGYPDGTFGADDAINRGEFATMLVRTLNLENDAASATFFKDVKGSEWYAGAVGAAYKAGIISGYPDQTFRANDEISREEMAKMMDNALAYRNKTTSLTTSEIESSLAVYNDGEKISAWARESVARMTTMEIMNGKEGGKFAPADTATRAEAATIFSRSYFVLSEI